MDRAPQVQRPIEITHLCHTRYFLQLNIQCVCAYTSAQTSLPNPIPIILYNPATYEAKCDTIDSSTIAYFIRES